MPYTSLLEYPNSRVSPSDLPSSSLPSPLQPSADAHSQSHAPSGQSPGHFSLNDPRDAEDGGSTFDFELGKTLTMIKGINSQPSSSHSYELVLSGDDQHNDRYFKDGRHEELGGSGVLVAKPAVAEASDVFPHQLDGSSEGREWNRIVEGVQVGRGALGDRGGSGGQSSQQRPHFHLQTPTDAISSPPNGGFDVPYDPMVDVHPALRGASQTSPPPEQRHQHQQDSQPEQPQIRNHSSTGDFFKDFDGVHYSPETVSPPQIQLSPTRIQDKPQASSQPQFHHPRPRALSYAASIQSPQSDSSKTSNAVYYPAPVPAVLNLPPLMARDNSARNGQKISAQHSSKVLSDISGDAPPINRYSGADFGNNSSPTESHNNQRLSVVIDDSRLAELSPSSQDHSFLMPSSPSSPELKDSSAVATLDSILDASARAPAVAFTDHPWTGVPPDTHVRRESVITSNNYRNSVAMTVVLHPGESPRSSIDGGDRDRLNPEEPISVIRPSPSFEILPNDPGGMPTTLLAELESRKAQMKSRTRTAASAFPTGIRSTLLQLDAVAQVQADSRRQKRPQLAWEGTEGRVEDETDEDVPLGLLYQGAGRGVIRPGRDEDVPLGLLVQRQIEDAEPLSKRRERLRQQSGVPQLTAQPPPRRFLEIPNLASGGISDEGEEGEEETLAQRMKRLKDPRKSPSADATDTADNKERRISTFGDGSLELNFNPATSPAVPSGQPLVPLEEGETLAQRRKRLLKEQMEAAHRQRLSEEAKIVQAEVRKRAAANANMATLLQNQHSYQQQQMLSAGMLGRNTPASDAAIAGQMPGGGGLIHQAGASLLRPQVSMVNMGIGMGGINMGIAGMGVGGGAGGGLSQSMQMTPQEIAMNNKQREMVERWRASVM